MRRASLLLLCAAAVGCDPASSLQNAEYRPYLTSLPSRDVPAAVAAFNVLDSKRGEFHCQAELETAQRAIWREKAGRVDPSGLDEVRAFESCLHGFIDASGVEQGLVHTKIVPHWVNHNFLPEVQARIEAEVTAARGRLDEGGCTGEPCGTLTVVGDIAVARTVPGTPADWATAREACRESDLGGLRPWRLPTKAELVALRESGKIASDTGFATAWSGDREWEERGEIQAWSLDLVLPSRSTPVAPKLVPVTKRGRAPRARVVCVHDLTKAPMPAGGDVDEMEQTLADAGCPADAWASALRLRDGLIVTWEPTPMDRPLAEACASITLCEGLSFRPPSAAEATKMAADPWLSREAERRCVAVPPEE